MASISIPPSTVRHCSGVILNHHDRWWLVEASIQGGDRTTILGLTGRHTRALTEQMRIQFPGAYGVAGTLYPASLAWSGDFSLVPSRRSPDKFDVDAYLRCAPATIPEIRLARITVETMLFPLPADFTSVLFALPDTERPVLAIRHCGLPGTTFELLTARCIRTGRPHPRWHDISNESVGREGRDILGWRRADDWITPRSR